MNEIKKNIIKLFYGNINRNKENNFHFVVFEKMWVDKSRADFYVALSKISVNRNIKTQQNVLLLH